MRILQRLALKVWNNWIIELCSWKLDFWPHFNFCLLQEYWYRSLVLRRERLRCDSRRHLRVSWWRELVSYQMLEVIRRGLNLFSIKITVLSFLVKTWKLRCLVKQKQNKTKKLKQQLSKTKKTLSQVKRLWSSLVLVMVLDSKGLYCCILMSGSRIVSQQ